MRGIVGWGEGVGGEIVEGLLAPVLIGQDPTNRIGLWQRMFHALYNGNNAVGLGGSAISAIDTALWDITGKAFGQPIYNLLGGKVRDRVAVYATGLYYTEGEFPTRLLDEARGYVEMGFMGMKTKVGGLPMDEDVKRVAALREAIGPDVKLMVDANQAYNATSAIRIGRRLEECDLVWFEEPVNAQDIEGYLQVKSALPMAIAGGENLRTRYEFSQFLARRAYDIAQPDVVNVGGITEMRNVAMTANTHGIQLNPHVWGSPVMIAASLHVAATLPPCPPSGTPEPFVQEPVMEFDRTPSEIREGPDGKPLRPDRRLPRHTQHPRPRHRNKRRRRQKACGVAYTGTTYTESRLLSAASLVIPLSRVASCPWRRIAVASSMASVTWR